MTSNQPESRKSGRRAIPSVSSLIEHVHSSERTPIDDRVLTRVIGRVVDSARVEIESGASLGREEIIGRLDDELALLESQRLTEVINATGVILHTNLGRAPVSRETAAAMANAAAAQVPLEIDPTTNQRGGRMSEISRLMRVLTGAEATLVVNNNAAAVLLVLSALASVKEVVVSRGEAVEIGGGFRIPDVLRQSGASMIEVGTTNRTYARDFAAAITDRTAALLTVHASNFRVEGFVAAPTIEELSEVAQGASLPLIDDLGSGSILQPSDFGLSHERTIGEGIAAGVDLVTASGDKLLGGPQAGLICGRADLIAMVEKHPLARAVRADKSTLAGVAATLRHHVRGEAVAEIPVWQMISADTSELKSRAERIVAGLADSAPAMSIVESDSTVGGGSLPGDVLQSWAVGIDHPHPESLATALRTGTPGVYGRIVDSRLLLDLRTVRPEHDQGLQQAIFEALESLPASGCVRRKRA